MGNSASTSRAQQDDTVDYGFLTPQGVYSGTPDWNQQIVAQLIVERRLAPFYRPLEEYDDNWDDEQILAARKLPPGEDVAKADAASRADASGSSNNIVSRSNSVHSSVQAGRRPGTLKEPSRLPEAMVYRGAVECPICFLYYPPNINHSRCCDQAICTECFVQIKRAEPTTTHIVSEPAACPYCVQDNFGVTYISPPWRAGIGADGSHLSIGAMTPRGPSQRPAEASRIRRKSFGPDSAEVVTIDQIRPDWEAKLAAVRAAVARRANRRIIMRQVGDRLIPVGVTSARIHPLNGEATIITNGEPGVEISAENEGRSRRSRRRQHQQQPQDINQLFGTMGLGGQDLEELMIMEAMRLSLLEHEEQQKKEAEEKKKKEAERLAKGGKPVENPNEENEAGPSSAASGLELPPIPTTSPIDVAQSPTRSLLPSGSSSSARHSPASRSLAESGSSPRQPEPSALSALAATSLRVSLSHSGSSGHSRSGSVTPSIHAATPHENAVSPPFGTLSAVASSHGVASAVLAASDGGTSDNAPTTNPDSLTGAASVPVSQSEVSVPTDPHREESSTSVTGATVPMRPAEVNRSVSSLFTGNIESQPYETLPSSPDTPSQHPLLTETPGSEVPVMALDSERGNGTQTGVPE